MRLLLSDEVLKKQSGKYAVEISWLQGMYVCVCVGYLGKKRKIVIFGGKPRLKVNYRGASVMWKYYKS